MNSDQNETSRSQRDIAEVSDDVSTTAHAAMENATRALQSAADQLRDQATKAVAYAKDEPIKALLMAAATGAALMAMVGLMLRSDD